LRKRRRVRKIFQDARRGVLVKKHALAALVVTKACLSEGECWLRQRRRVRNLFEDARIGALVKKHAPSRNPLMIRAVSHGRGIEGRVT
jgi:hypothetical protein